MAYVLAVSGVVNFVLAGWLWWVVRGRRLRPLPKDRPDWERVEGVLRELMERMACGQWYEIQEVRHSGWVCVVLIRYKAYRPDAWRSLRELLEELRQRCGVPGRISGFICNDEQPPRMIGQTLELGYSPCLGYASEACGPQGCTIGALSGKSE